MGGTVIKQNPKLVLRNGTLGFEKEYLSYQPASNRILVRNHFTLTATNGEMKYLESLANQNIRMSHHLGYTSVGTVEAVGDLVNTVQKGDIILTSAVFSKYHLLSNDDGKNFAEVLYKSSYQRFDLVDLLFLPLICAASHLVTTIASEGCEKALFIGDDQMFLILALLLCDNGYEIVIYSDEAKLDMLREFLGEEIELLTNEHLFFEKLAQEEVMGIYFSSFSQQPLKSRTGFFLDGKVYDAADFIFDGPPWKRPHLLSAGVDIVLQGRIDFKNMIAQHVHGEYIEQMKSYLEQGYYGGRMLVYDW